MTLIDPRRRKPGELAPQGDKEGREEDGESSLESLDFVKELLPIVDEARDKVTDLMEDMVVRGLRDLVRGPAVAVRMQSETDALHSCVLAWYSHRRY